MLIMVIGMVVVLLMLASIAAVTVNRMRDDQARENARIQAMVDSQSTKATLLYLMSTQRVTFAGLTVDDQMPLSTDEKEMLAEGETPLSNSPVGNEIRLDNSLYSGLGNTRFSLQDDRGRISINWSNPVILNRWLDRLHVPDDKRAGLFAALLDYQDPDDLYRLNGAEAPQYLEKGLPKPPNRPLVTPAELRGVMGWDTVLAPLDTSQLLNQISMSRDGQMSVNSAPVDVLELLPGVTHEMAQRIVNLRAVHAISDPGSLALLLPTLPAGNDIVSLHPGISGTLAIWPNDVSAGWLSHWTLTPFDNGGRPWHIDYEIRFPARAVIKSETVLAASTPLLSHQIPAHP